MHSLIQIKSVNGASDIVTSKLRNRARVITHADRAVEMLTQMEAAVSPEEAPHPALLEFHPTDVCDLDCTFCTYNDRVSESFPWEALEQLAHLKPRAIVLAGGGEPVLYRSSGKGFSDLVLKLAELLPKTKIGLITNGALFPGEEAASRLAWIRISLDAGNSETYDLTKNRGGASPLDVRINNLIAYARAAVPFIGAGYVFHRSNFNQLADFLELTYRKLESAMPGLSRRLNVQFRAACGIQSCECPSPKYSESIGRLMTPDLLPSWAIERDRQIRRVETLMEADDEFAFFVRTQTNFFGEEIAKPVEKVSHFSKCYLSLVRVIVRANGDVFPCVMKASQRHMPAGNVVRDGARSLWPGLHDYFNLKSGRCRGQADCCNIDGIKNVLLESALNSNDWSATDGEAGVDVDPFF